MRNYKILLIFITLPAVFILTFAFFPSTTKAAIVQCGTSETKPCTICDVVILFKNIIDFVLTILTPAIATLLYLFAGFLIILGGANPSQVATGKSIFKTTTIGLLIIFGSWLVVNSILKSLAGSSDVSNNWYQIECAEVAVQQPPAPGPGGGPAPSGGANNASQKVAQALLDSKDVTFSTSADCAGNNAQTSIDAIAAGNLPNVCSPSCNCVAGGPSGKVNVNPDLLDGVESLANYIQTQYGVGVTVTSLTTGIHEANSTHYTGEGVDIVVNDTNPAHWQAAEAFLKKIGGNAVCELTTGGETTNDPNCNLSKVNHIHWTLRK